MLFIVRLRGVRLAVEPAQRINTRLRYLVERTAHPRSLRGVAASRVIWNAQRKNDIDRSIVIPVHCSSVDTVQAWVTLISETLDPYPQHWQKQDTRSGHSKF